MPQLKILELNFEYKNTNFVINYILKNKKKQKKRNWKDVSNENFK